MNGKVLEKFIKVARKVNQAVELEGDFDSDFVIEPTDELIWEHTNMLWVEDKLVDITSVNFAKVVPNKEQREQQWEQLLEGIPKPLRDRL